MNVKQIRAELDAIEAAVHAGGRSIEALEARAQSVFIELGAYVEQLRRRGRQLSPEAKEELHSAIRRFGEIDALLKRAARRRLLS